MKNVTLTGVGVSGCAWVGGIAGQNYGTVENCSVKGMVTGAGAYSNNIGGIVGQNNGTISGCSAEGTVTGNGSNVGGIAGINTPIYDTGIGGIAGYNNQSTFTACYWENNQEQGIGDNQADTTIETTKVDDTATWMQAKKAMNNALQDLTT